MNTYLDHLLNSFCILWIFLFNRMEIMQI